MSTEAKCSSCETLDESNLLAEPTIRLRLAAHPLWTLTEAGRLSRQFEAKNFQLAMEFLQQAGAVAERHGHHPDMHLTSYRCVELVLYTHSVGGITAEDFKMVEALDSLPVVYSLKWKKAHPELPSQAAPPAPPAAEHTVFHLRGAAGSRPHTAEAHGGDLHAATAASVHNSSMRDDGTQLHDHDFVVHTGHNILKGHSDSKTFKHGSDPVQSEGVPPSRDIPADTWGRMVNSLLTLKSSGFDVGDAEHILPMVESHTIHPAMEGDVFKFYQHLLRRLEPAARETEPVSIVEAALGFVEGYEELKAIGPFHVQ